MKISERHMSLTKPYATSRNHGLRHDQARRGYHLNMFCMSLMKPENRPALKADERAYLDAWPMSEDQKRRVLDRDYNR